MPVTINISPEELDELVADIESDWGFEYANATGERALVRLRQLIGGTPDRNMEYAHERAAEGA